MISFGITDIYESLIKLKEGNYIKILEIEPLNLNLKSEFEKEIILNSYRNFLKNLDSNIQIIIQSKNIELNSHLERIKSKENFNNQKLISNYYIYIQKIKNQSLYSKKFYIIVSQKNDSNISIKEINKKLIKKCLNVKENLEKCGNRCRLIEGKELSKILYSFINVRLNQKAGGEF